MDSAKLEHEVSAGGFHAHVWPFLYFMGFLALCGLVTKLAVDFASSNDLQLPLFWAEPRFWIYPLQTLVCGFLLWKYWKSYHFAGIGRPLLTVGVGILVLALWISPQLIFGSAPRTDGFDPEVFADTPALYWTTLFLRFLRLVVVVPLLEEIFWRGFLLRYLVRHDFLSVPFGKFRPIPFLAVALLFGLAHSGPDFPAAILTGILYNALATWTRSLGACVAAHAITNLLLGFYILATKQWGFW